MFDQRHNAAEDLDQYVEPDLKPMEESEFQVGLSREVGLGGLNNVVLGARYIHKDLVRTIEDVGVNVPGVGTTYYIANPGEGITLSLNDPSIPAFPKAEREDDGLELTFDRRFQNNWMLFGSYTLSRLYGNYSGLASSDENGRVSPNVNRFFDHIENTFDRNGDLVLPSADSVRIGRTSSRRSSRISSPRTRRSASPSGWPAASRSPRKAAFRRGCRSSPMAEATSNGRRCSTRRTFRCSRTSGWGARNCSSA